MKEPKARPARKPIKASLPLMIHGLEVAEAEELRDIAYKANVSLSAMFGQLAREYVLEGKWRPKR